jgi:hypothetical protein
MGFSFSSISKHVGERGLKTDRTKSRTDNFGYSGLGFPVPFYLGLLRILVGFEQAHFNTT